jgi:glycosyltransferase involved in cell wall biosynthesis
MKKILMIAFHYPPFRGGSGVHRTLKFSRYLPDYGWQPIILTANPRAYPQVGDDQLREIPLGIAIKRAFALDTARHLSIRGSYLRWMALPDQWITWWMGAVPVGLGIIREHRPEAIWSTYPIATAHLIGLTLHRLTGIPWMIDLRDPMVDDVYPEDHITRRTYRWIEEKATRYASYLIFTTRSTQQIYLDRYPELPPGRCIVIPNGYDEEDFKQFDSLKPIKKYNDHKIRLLHNGLIYRDYRDPKPLFKAISRLKNEARVDRKDLRIDLRASGSEDYYSAMIRELGIDDLVHFLRALPFREGLEDCSNADGLVLFQDASCNHQIPAKVYEYLRLQKPILALTDSRGDTAQLLRETGGATIFDLTDEEALYQFLPEFMSRVRNGKHPLPDTAKVKLYTRKNQASELAKCLSKVIRQEGNI